MKTGEGKTLVATLPAYLNALAGDGVHVVTVNEYLAKRDAEWMGKIYRFLGLTVGIIQHDCTNDERKEAYNADITYGTNNELGFDYLRDNMVVYKENKVQRGHSFAIVDEVDSILIDEARTPLIISGQGDKSTDLYERADDLAKTMKYKKITESDNKVDNDQEYIDEGIDYIVDEKAKTATLTPVGVKKAEKFFGIADITGAYVAGIVLSRLHDSAYIEEKMDINSYMIFGPIFFASIGLKTSLDGLSLDLLWFSIGFVLVALVSKIIGCGLTSRLCGFRGSDPLKIGVGMMTRGEVALIVAQKGLSSGLVSPVYFTSVILLIIVSSVITPIILKLIFSRDEKKKAA